MSSESLEQLEKNIEARVELKHLREGLVEVKNSVASLSTALTNHMRDEEAEKAKIEKKLLVILLIVTIELMIPGAGKVFAGKLLAMMGVL